MYKNKNTLAVIPARSGSKGLPNKNIKFLSGKPLIAWTIQCARKSIYIDKIIVSTENKDIALMARRYGADVPFLRPPRLATNKAKTIDVILHALDWLNEHDKKYDLILLLQPTSPLRAAADIDRAIKSIFKKKNARAIVSVCKTQHHPWWVNKLPPDLSMKNFIKSGIKNRSRQELPVFYNLNGAIYLGYQDYIRKQHGFFGAKTFAYIMPWRRSVDIDTESDFALAKYFMGKTRASLDEKKC